MKMSVALSAQTLAAVCATALLCASVASAETPSAGSAHLVSAAQQNKYAFVLFWKQDDRATRQMQQTLGTELAGRDADAMWVAVQVNDRAEQSLIARFDATRLPLPATVAIAPNGAVTSVNHLQLSPQQVAGSFVSPGFAACVKALQSKKIVLACVQPAEQTSLPRGVVQFANDPHYKGRTEVVRLRADDPRESSFYRRVKVRTNAPRGTVLFFAPPGSYLGTFDAGVSSSKLVSTIKAAGQCCPDCEKHRGR